jgi:hypothetical protein
MAEMGGERTLIGPGTACEHPLMYFADLTPYEYARTEPDTGVLNVGWLSSEHPYSQGTCPERFVLKLEELLRHPVNPFRGSHLCEFCPKPPVLIKNGLRFVEPPKGTAGNGEIRVRGRDGLIYAAPVLIGHYIKEHGYLPPESFIDAVCEGEAAPFTRLRPSAL